MRLGIFKLFLPIMLAAGLTTLSALGGVIFTPLVSFTGTSGLFPGAAPYGQLTLGPDGNFYGTTSAGGSNNLGTVYRLTRDGDFTSILSFDSTNGANPYIGMVKARDGNLYGTTTAGGVSNWGTIFMVTTNGTLTNLFSFTGIDHPFQGANPASTLIQVDDGSFYGTANFGGTTNVIPGQGVGCGTVFHFKNDGSLTTSVVFEYTNGAHPSGGLVLADDGNFYGTTTWGGLGVTNTFQGYGTVFKLNPDGTFANLYKFTGADDGGFIYAGLVQGDDGWLYGAAFQGGSNLLYGTLFKMSTNGDYVALHSFGGNESDAPYAGLTKGRDGNFYGTTYGFHAGYGSVFSLTPDGAFTNLFSFNIANGSHPAGVLLQGPDGDFYGTTSAGGANGRGTIFKLSVPMPPVITSLSRSNNLLSLTWTTVAGQSYRVQYSEDLSPANWVSLAGFATATGGTMTAANFDSSVSATQRYYRIELQ